MAGLLLAALAPMEKKLNESSFPALSVKPKWTVADVGAVFRARWSLSIPLGQHLVNKLE